MAFTSSIFLFVCLPLWTGLYYLAQLVLRGMQAGVAAVIADVVITMGWDILKRKKVLPILIMVGSFIAACVFDVNVIVIILVCAVIGLLATLHDERNGKAGA